MKQLKSQDQTFCFDMCRYDYRLSMMMMAMLIFSMMIGVVIGIEDERADQEMELLFAKLTHPESKETTHHVVESDSHVVMKERTDGSFEFHLFEPSGKRSIVTEAESAKARAEQHSSRYDASKQWLAWYYKSCLPCTTSYGFKSFQSTWTVPPLPTAASNLAIFNGLQAAPDSQSWNWILQPILAHGNWMLGSYNDWIISGVMCPASGSCLWSKPIATRPGNIIEGTITMIGMGPPYTYNITARDRTWNNSTTLTFSSNYFAPWAYVSLEHNPAGSLSSCSQLPATNSITFTGNTLIPSSIDSWAGAQNVVQCGLGVETFIFDDSSLPITI